MNSIHLQIPINNWLAAVAELREGSIVKLFQSEPALQVKQASAGRVKVDFRHWFGDGYGWYFGAADKRAAARHFLDRFVDGTFLEYAPLISYVEEFNEYYANSQSPAERANLVAWGTAVAQEWASYRDQYAQLAHIPLVLANTAVGNDIPLDLAQVAVQYDCVMGYHSYWPVAMPAGAGPEAARSRTYTPRSYSAQQVSFRDVQGRPLAHYMVEERHVGGPMRVQPAAESGLGIMPGEWPWYSGRFTSMDTTWKAQGIKVRWLITESGPVYHAGGGHLDPGGGWRHPAVYNGNADLYIQSLEYFGTKATAWNQSNEGRLLDNVLFTSGGGDWWKHFETRQPELEQIARHFAGWDWSPPDDPEPDPTPGLIPVSPVYSQRDPRWANVQLGTGDKTIGNWGCLTVAYAMMANTLRLAAEDKDPAQFNQILIAAGAMNGSAVKPAALALAYPGGVTNKGWLPRSNAAMRPQIREYLDQGIPVPARVDFVPSTPQFEQHWVLLIGWAGENFWMADPWNGTVGRVNDSYGIAGSDILEALFYQPKLMPRTWSKHVILLPQTATAEQHTAVSTEAFGTKTEVAFAADSAFARHASIKHLKVTIYNVEEWGGKAALEGWAAEHYGLPEEIVYKTI